MTPPLGCGIHSYHRRALRRHQRDATTHGSPVPRLLHSRCPHAEAYAAQNRTAFRTDHIPISAVAISSGINDAGAFELAFSSTRYVPLESAGAISSWRLDLPEAVQQFDYEAISDVLLHVQYTVLDGGVMLRSVASEAVRNASETKDDQDRDEVLWAVWDLKNDFASEWRRFILESRPLAAVDGAGTDNEGESKIGQS